MERVAKLLKLNHLTHVQYNKNGKYHSSTIGRRFNGWTKACNLAGISIEKFQRFEVTNEELIADIKNIANLLEKNTITSGEYTKSGGKYNSGTILRRFKTWNNALNCAELNKSSNRNTSDEELLIEIERIWTKLGRQPTTNDIKEGISMYSLNTFARRFGGWRASLEKFIEYINNDENIVSKNEEKKNADLVQTIEFTGNNAEFKSKTSRETNLRLRFKVLQRDNFKCCACGASPAKDPNVNLHIDHIIPWSKGGETVFDNLQTLCQNCNLGKSDL